MARWNSRLFSYIVSFSPFKQPELGTIIMMLVKVGEANDSVAVLGKGNK